MSFRRFYSENPILKSLIKREIDEPTLMASFSSTRIKPKSPEYKRPKQEEKVFGNPRAVQRIISIKPKHTQVYIHHNKKLNKINEEYNKMQDVCDKIPHVCAGPFNSGRSRSLHKLTSAIKLKLKDHRDVEKKKVTWVDQVNKGSSIARYSTMVFDHKLGKFREQDENEKDEESTSIFHCNCRDIRDCPLQGSCLSKNITFKIKVHNNQVGSRTFYGTCRNTTFKSRFYQIKHLMKKSNKTYMNPFARYIWQLKRRKQNFDVQYRVVDQPAVSRGSSSRRGARKSCSCHVRVKSRKKDKK